MTRTGAVGMALAWALSSVCMPGFAQPCAGMDKVLTDTKRAEYAPLVAATFGPTVSAKQVEILRVLESGTWSAVEAATPVADIATFFFEASQGRKRLRVVWGGWADASERPKLVGWARKQGVPESLARCFAAFETAR